MNGIFARSDGTPVAPMGVPWYTAGRNAELQLFTPPWVRLGQTVMKPGRSWFSVPSPYVIQEPMLGLTNVSLPVCNSSNAPPCLEFEPCIELITQRSSTQPAMFGNNSLTGMPLEPCCANLNGERR